MKAVIAVFVFVGLAVGTLYWLFVAQDTHDFRRQLSQENRHAEIVGAKPAPKAPIEIKIIKHRDSCMFVDRAEIDGEKVWIYAHNGCGSATTFAQAHWKLIAPDGTVIQTDRRYLDGDVDAGQKIEMQVDIKPDPRAATLEVSMTNYPN